MVTPVRCHSPLPALGLCVCPAVQWGWVRPGRAGVAHPALLRLPPTQLRQDLGPSPGAKGPRATAGPQGTATSPESSSCRAWEGTGEPGRAAAKALSDLGERRGESQGAEARSVPKQSRTQCPQAEQDSCGHQAEQDSVSPSRAEGGSSWGQGRERPLQQQEKTNCIDRTWRAVGSGSPLRVMFRGRNGEESGAVLLVVG